MALPYSKNDCGGGPMYGPEQTPMPTDERVEAAAKAMKVAAQEYWRSKPDLNYLDHEEAEAIEDGLIPVMARAALTAADAVQGEGVDAKWQWFAEHVRIRQEVCAEAIDTGTPPMAAMDGLVDWIIDQFEAALDTKLTAKEQPDDR